MIWSHTPTFPFLPFFVVTHIWILDSSMAFTCLPVPLMILVLFGSSNYRISYSLLTSLVDQLATPLSSAGISILGQVLSVLSSCFCLLAFSIIYIWYTIYIYTHTQIYLYISILWCLEYSKGLVTDESCINCGVGGVHIMRLGSQFVGQGWVVRTTGRKGHKGAMVRKRLRNIDN